MNLNDMENNFFPSAEVCETIKKVTGDNRDLCRSSSYVRLHEDNRFRAEPRKN